MHLWIMNVRNKFLSFWSCVDMYWMRGAIMRGKHHMNIMIHSGPGLRILDLSTSGYWINFSRIMMVSIRWASLEENFMKIFIKYHTEWFYLMFRRWILFSTKPKWKRRNRIEMYIWENLFREREMLLLWRRRWTRLYIIRISLMMINITGIFVVCDDILFELTVLIRIVNL